MGTSVMSREAAAALMCKLGCLTELLQSNARAKVPTALRTDHQIQHANLIMPSVSSMTQFPVSSSAVVLNWQFTTQKQICSDGVMESGGDWGWGRTMRLFSANLSVTAICNYKDFQ